MDESNTPVSLDDLAMELVRVDGQQSDIQKQIMQATAKLQKDLETYRAMDIAVRDAIRLAMEATGTKKFENDFVSFTYVSPSERVSIDTTRLRTHHPDLAEEFKKVTPVKASVRIKVKGE